MILNSHGAQTPQDRLARAKDMLSMLENGLSAGNPLRSALQQAARQLRKHSDYYLMHEHLEAVNAPCYFLEFAAAAQQAGLAYLTDAEPQSCMASNYGNNVAVLHNALSADAPREMREQYLDFAVGRQFRKSLLIHEERASNILETPEVNVFEKMHFGARLKTATAPAGASSKERHYRTARGIGIASSEPTFVAIAEALRQAWPHALSFAELLDAARSKAKKTTTHDELTVLVLTHLVAILNAGALEYRYEPLGYDPQAAKPQWIPGLKILRQLADKNALTVGTYNLWHQHVRLPADDVSTFIVRQIDGRTPVADLRTKLRDALASGEVTHPSGKSLKRVRNLDSVAQTLLNDAMNVLRSQGFLL